ncbi:type II secretion system protein N [Planctobacterium marinum]|uniref:type II secretion system protein N n=1 Tax=Planctobacterium marinum TaxID=1631968 RepID=UPI001E30D98B|nr:type II secretion system protein N [Planctobacterium marinum]MCC2606486.1 type II secretion system protein N [Planctobacterium marinum]
MKKQLSITLAAIGLFLFFLVANLPASQVIARVTLPKEVSVIGVSGTLWAGHADQVIVQGLALSNVNWDLAFLPLLLGKATVHIDAGSARDSDQISLQGDITLTPSGISAQNTTLFAPTPLLMAQVQLPIAVDAAGRARVQVETFSYHKETGCQSLKGTGSWLNAGVAGFNGQVNLGNFEATLECDQGPIKITTRPDNSLNLAAATLIHHNGKFSVEGQFKVSDALPREVHDAAKFFGAPDEQGFYQIKL